MTGCRDENVQPLGVPGERNAEVTSALRIFDADNHYYEPLDAFTRHLPTQYLGRVAAIADIDGRKYHIIGGKLDRTVKNPTFNPVAKPGTLAKYFRGNPDRTTVNEALKDREPIRPEYRDAKSRLSVMDEQGVDMVWLFPTLGVMYEERLKDDPEGAVEYAWAFNRWLEEDWGFVIGDRIFAAPYISLADPGQAAQILEWSLERGARVVCTPPKIAQTSFGPRRPAQPLFDRFWDTVAESGVTVAVHAGNAGYTRHGYAPDETIVHDNSDATAWHWLQHERPIFDYMASLVYV
jgi:hypothetical protein